MKSAWILVPILSLFSICSYAENKPSRSVYTATLISKGTIVSFYLNGFKLGESHSKKYYESRARIGNLLKPTNNVVEVKLAQAAPKGTQYSVTFEHHEIDSKDQVVEAVSTSILDSSDNTAELVTSTMVEQPFGRTDLALWNKTTVTKELSNTDRKIITALVNKLRQAIYSGNTTDIKHIMSVRYQDESRAMGLNDDELMNVALSQHAKLRKNYTFKKPTNLTTKALTFTLLNNQHVWHVTDELNHKQHQFSVAVQIGESPEEQFAIDTYFAKIDGVWTLIR